MMVPGFQDGPWIRTEEGDLVGGVRPTWKPAANGAQQRPASITRKSTAKGGFQPLEQTVDFAAPSHAATRDRTGNSDSRTIADSDAVVWWSRKSDWIWLTLDDRT